MLTGCSNFYGKVFAHLTAAIGIAAASAETLDIGSQLLGRSSALVQVLANIAILFVLMFAVFLTKPGGALKYIAFAGFAVWIGQVAKPLVDRLKEKSSLTRVLLLTTGVFGGMMALGFYDRQNLLGFGPYLFAGLIGLILAQLLVLAFASPKERAEAFQVLRLIGVAIFAGLTAVNVQQIKESAKACRRISNNGKGGPDYPVESMNLFLDFVNLFSSIGGSQD